MNFDTRLANVIKALTTKKIAHRANAAQSKIDLLDGSYGTIHVSEDGVSCTRTVKPGVAKVAQMAGNYGVLP